MESNTKRDSSIVNKKKKKKGDPTWGLNPKVEQHCTIVSLFYGIILRAVKQWTFLFLLITGAAD